MNDITIREPKQQRAIAKKEKIIEAGFRLICENGYYNTNTAEIAKEAGVSTGIVYQYFKDKYDILLEGLEKYGDSIFFPMPKNSQFSFEKKEFDHMIKNMIQYYIKNHKLSLIAHEEIMAMIHSDQKVAIYYYRREMEMTKAIQQILIHNQFQEEYLFEKVHIMMGLIDNLCHEIIYHQHYEMDYDTMTDLVIDSIRNLFKKDLT